MTYAFTDGEVAAQRLRLVSEVFAPPTTAFLRAVAPPPPALALDLGCGPGHSTHLLARTLGAQRTVGLDASPAFIALAEATATDTVGFRRHDVTRVPFPLGPADLAYCRLLLMHLPDPRAALGTWATQLRSGGLLLLDEVEAIETRNPTFTAYLAIVEDMLQRVSGTLYIGARLDGMVDEGMLRRHTSQTTRLAVPDPRAAAMFALNLAAWGGDPSIRARHGDATIERLAGELAAIAARSSAASGIAWHLRQIVLERV